MLYRENSDNLFTLNVFIFWWGNLYALSFSLITVAPCCALLKFQEYKMGNQTLSDVMT